MTTNASVICFSASGGRIQKYQDHPEGGIVGEALLFYVGKHTDMYHNEHIVTPERLHTIASNTNAEFNRGKDIPLKFEHQQKIVDPKGNVNHFGKMFSAVSCRPIEEKDLVNPRLTHLIGRLGAFAQVHVRDKVDEVKKKTIQAISAGIDPINNKFVEISSVDDPSLLGAALLFSNPKPNYGGVAQFSQHGLTDYKQAKQRVDAWEKPHAELQKRFDIFLGTLQAIASEEEQEQHAYSPNGKRRKAIDDFCEELMDYLNVEDDSELGEDFYETNPYANELISPNVTNTTNYSNPKDEEDNILTFESPVNKHRVKRRRRG